jgi:hypothetical protein
MVIAEVRESHSASVTPGISLTATHSRLTHSEQRATEGSATGMRSVDVAARAADTSASLLRVGDALRQQHPHVVVGKPVDRALPFAPECDEVPIAKEPKLVAHGRLRHTGN